MPITALQRVLDHVQAILQANFPQLHDMLLAYVALLGGLAVVWTCYAMLRGGASLPTAFGFFCRIGLVIYALGQWPWFLNGLKETAMSIGLFVTGSQLTVPQLLDPGLMIRAGVSSGEVLWRAFLSNISWRTPWVGLVFLGAWIGYMTSYTVIAFKLFYFQLEFLIASVAGVCLLPALCFKPIAPLAQGVLSYAANSFARFLMTSVLVGALWTHLQSITALVKPSEVTGLAAIDITMQESFIVAATAVVIAATFLSVNRLASMLTGGLPGMGGGESLGSLLRATASVASGGATLIAGGATAALGVARGAAAAGGAAGGAMAALPAARSAGSVGGAVRELAAGASAGAQGSMQARIGQLMAATTRGGERTGDQALHAFLQARMGRQDIGRGSGARF